MDWERRQAQAIRAVPHVTLVLATLLALIVEPERAAAICALAVAAELWVLWISTLHPAWADRAGLMVGYVVVLFGLFAALLAQSPMFGIFVWCGYLQSGFLPGRWKWAGATATAALLAVTYVGGYQNLHGSTLAVYAVFTVVGTALGGAFLHFGVATGARNAEQRRMLDVLTETNTRLEAALEENAGLHAQLLTQAREAGVLDERARMAREIHDTLAQGFAGIVAQLQAARQNPEKWLPYTDRAQALARENLAEARRSVQALRPEPLEDAHLPEAIAGMSERWSDGSGIPVGFETTGEPKPMIPDVEVALFRVAQEALTNVGKHARASRVGLTLSYMDDVVLLDVVDDGVGFATGLGGDGFGLSSMRQRLMRVAGRLEIESGPGEGTAVNASVPAIPAVPATGAK